jgi:hypothetical protein
VSDPDLTPAEEQVRRLLADARYTEPLPDDVADRLDRVLADLGAEDEDPARRTPPPIDLAARRRRLARNVLVAAAAVVVLGVGISRIDLGAGGADSGGSASESAPRADSDGADTAGGALASIPLVLRSETFDQQVRRLQAGHALNGLAGTPADLATEDAAPSGRSDPVPTDCDDPAWGPGERIPVRYDGARGVLVLRPPAGGTRDVDLFLCGDAEVTRSVTVPVD